VTTDSTPPDSPWPSAPPGTPGLKLGFPGAHEVATPSRHLGRRGAILLLSAGLGVVALVLVALLATPGPAPHCKPLACQGPPIGHPGEPTPTPQSAVGPAVVSNTLYTSPAGYSLRYVPASNVQKTANGISLTYAFNSNAIGTGYLDVVGGPASGTSDQSLVTQLAATLWGSNAQPIYQMPNPMIGYHPAYGEAFNVQPASSDGTTQTDRALVSASTYNGFSIVVLVIGPLLPTVNTSSEFFNDHPSPANVYLAYFYGTDSLLNSVVFPK
jgi:hypothetical protein